MLRELCAASFPALGTTARVVVDDPGSLAAAEGLLRDEVDAIDRTCSRFRDDSELSGLNAAGGREWGASAMLIEAIGVALRAAAATDGDVDPTVGRAMGELGYDRDFSLIAGPLPGVRVRLSRSPGWRAIRLDRARRTVTIPAGMSIDLGATAKAFAADRAAGAIHAATGAGALVSLGGDIALAGVAPGDGWPVRVTDDHREESGEGETVSLRAGGLATSSTTVRRWGPDTDPRHHILDPRSGTPVAEVWRTVSVAAGSCVDANIASTAAIVRGRRAVEWLAGAGLPARLVARDGEVVHVAGWPTSSR